VLEPSARRYAAAAGEAVASGYDQPWNLVSAFARDAGSAVDAWFRQRPPRPGARPDLERRDAAGAHSGHAGGEDADIPSNDGKHSHLQTPQRCIGCTLRVPGDNLHNVAC
jgi:hypothetical protein